MKRTTVFLPVSLLLTALGCGILPGAGHPLQGTWSGLMFGSTEFSIVIDESGTVTDILADGSPSADLLGGQADDGPQVFILTITHDTLGPTPMHFLVDTERGHAAAIMFLGSQSYLGVFQKDATSIPTFFEDDILGTWSGYGYAYSQADLDFVPFSPVSAEAFVRLPNNAFRVTTPSSTFTGAFDDVETAVGQYGGMADVTNAAVVALMARDKQFVAVGAIPDGTTNPNDQSFYALTRE